MDELRLNRQYSYAALFKLLKEHENRNSAASSDENIFDFNRKKKFASNYLKELAIGSVNFKNSYVLIIDEINRGNIAAILGELITLLEDDKRTGNNEALTVALPYSKENFSVPSNLYIIGTMNTADRSVESLDTALRRRFTFKEMMPQAELLTQKFEDNTLQLDDLLTAINERIELLLDKDHIIGHSFFMDLVSWEKLHDAFNQKIIPQLKEYFYGDFGKIAAILGSGFVSAQNDKRVKLFSVNGTDYNDSEKPVYRFESFINNGSFDKDKFINAVQALMQQVNFATVQ